MNMCKYCKDKNFTKEEYINFKNNIKATTKAIKSKLEYKGGMYYNTNTLFKNGSNNDIKVFIIDELKKLNVEFIKDNKYYRVVD
ncbi:hypothetical protein RSJ2_4164 (plasmid) [Clostridium botulinum]|uniref:hypothetical protein n=1 Tax=Clostridium botulinum TaxID=1491 RepID=UPI000463B750|nr:hypothetical protein [Clostridium botulinum]APR02452.1 hypothetical protein RSJ2_4164 [Clostridium botulinum]